MTRGIRGAITAKKNNKSEIISAATKLVAEMMSQNKVKPEDVASIIFTATEDLKAEFPAKAARLIGLDNVPLLCAREIDVPGSLKRCIRILMHINTNKSLKEIKHIYLEGAQILRKEIDS